MKKSVLLATSLLISTAASADVIRCSFTEPFVTSTYSMTQSTLSYTGFDDAQSGKPTVVKNVSFQIKGPGVFELVAKDGKVLQTLTLNNKGSDGMSDTVYPYDVKDNTEKTMKGYGGCTSNYLKSKSAE